MKKIFTYIFILFFATTLLANAENVKFAQVTDIHIGPKTDQKTASSIDHLKAAVNSINANNDIDFVVFTGDCIDKSNMPSLKVFCQIVHSLNKPYYILLGNHDAHKICGIPKDTYMKYVNASNKYQKTDSPNYTFAVNNDIEAICLDCIVPNVPSSHGYFSDETLLWFKKTMKENQDKKVLIFQHFPIIPPREQKNMTILEPDNYNTLLMLNSNILLIASGHYHQGGITVDDDHIYHISTPSLLCDHQYRVVDISYKKNLFQKASDFEIKTELVDAYQK